MVDEDRAFVHAGEGAVGAVDNVAQVVVVADAGEHQVRPRGRLGRGGAQAPAVLLDPGFRLGAGAVKDGHLVAGPGQVPGHGIAHGAKADERRFGARHVRFSCAGNGGGRWISGGATL